MRNLLASLPKKGRSGQMTQLSRETLRLHTELAISTPDEMSPARLNALAAALGSLSADLSAAYLG